MELQELGVITPTGIHTNIAAAVNAAKNAPGAAVWIPAWYTGGETVPANPSVPVFDMRGSTGTFTGGSAGKNVIDGNDPKYGLFWDTVLLCDGVVTSGSPNFSSASATFTSADIGKTLKATSGGVGCGENQALNSVTTISGKIISVTNAHTVVLDTNAVGTAVSGATFAYGHLDDVGLTAMETAGKASLNCPVYILPAGLGMINSQHFNDKTAISSTCQAIGSQVTSQSGVRIKGQGQDATGIILGPGFDPSTCTGGTSNNRCIGGMNGGVYTDFFVHGICDNRSGKTANVGFLGLGYSDFTSGVMLRCYGQQDAGNFASAVTESTLGGVVNSLGIDGFGSRGVQVNSNSMSFNYLSVGDINTGNTGFIFVGAALSVFINTLNMFFGPAGTNTYGLVVSSGATLQVQNLQISENLGTNAHLGVVNSGTFYVSGGLTLVNGNTGSTAIVNQSGGKIYSQNLQAKGGATGNDFNNPSGATFIDQGGNVPLQGRITSAAGSTWNGVGAFKGSCSGVATASSTLGLYGLGQLSALTCTSTTVNLGQVAKVGGTAYNLVVSATAGGVNASSGVVTVLKNGVAQTVTCTLGTGTTCADTAHTFTFVAGDVISVQFTTQAADTLAGVSATVVTM